MAGRWREVVLVGTLAAAAVGVFSLPALPQDPAYHVMADRRTLLGIPHALNVLSNLPFAVTGGLGLAAVAAARRRLRSFRADAWRAAAYGALFGGVALTAFGSSYYHLAPDNARLIWDRLPMTVGFMGLLAAMLDERVRRGLARVALVPLLIVGAFSVAWWGYTESRGAGDLRLYGLVQFGSLALVILLLILYPDREPDAPPGTRGYVVAALVLYAVAKVFEALDTQVFALGGIVSGHTLKHLAAAAGLVPLAMMIRSRIT